MNAALSLPPGDDLDMVMRHVARNLAQGIYELPKILEFCGVKPAEFYRWNEHPRFLSYLKTETEAWLAAGNTAERVKLKAGIMMEEWLPDVFTELRDRKQPLNHRVELSKLVAKMAGMGESSVISAGGGGGGGFSLQINISPGQTTTINASKNIEDAVVEDIPQEAPKRGSARVRIPETFDADDLYDPLVSPDTLSDL